MASAYFDWLQDTSLLVSERWPALDNGARLDVRLSLRASGQSPHLTRRVYLAQVATVNDVVLYDVRTLPPYRAALEADDEVRCLRACLPHSCSLTPIRRAAHPRQVGSLRGAADAAF